MALWNKTEAESSVPKFLPTDENTYLVDLSEAMIQSNRDVGLRTPGWTLHASYVDANGNTRRKTETIVAMKVTPEDAGIMFFSDTWTSYTVWIDETPL